MKRLLLSIFFVASFFSPPLVAEGHRIEGTINIVGSTFFILSDKDGDEQTYQITAANRSIESSLRGLRSGDYVEAEGVLHKPSDTFLIKTIFFVGIRRLLGSWVNKSNAIFHFLDFRYLNLYRFIKPQEFPARPQRFQYHISPESNNSWSIWISNEQKYTLVKCDL